MKWVEHPCLERPTTEEMAGMEPETLVALHRAYHEAIGNAQRDPYRYGFVLENWRKAEELLRKHDTLMVLGGNRCLAGEQVVPDPVSGTAVPVSEIAGNFHVTAWDAASGRFTTALALRPFRKPVQPLYRLTLSNGQTLSCSAEHQVATPSGWQAAGDLRPGSPICGTPPGDGGQTQPPAYWPDQTDPSEDIFREASRQGDGRSSQTVAGSLGDCPSSLRLCDGQPRLEGDCAQGTSPSQAGAQGCAFPFGSSVRQIEGDGPRSDEGTQDGSGSTPEHSHCGPESARPSILGGPGQSAARFAGTQSRGVCTPCKSVSPLLVDRGLLQDGSQWPAGSGPRQSTGEFPEQGNQWHHASSGWGSGGIVTLVKVDYLRDDVVWDFTVPEFYNYVAGGVINHNSAKTQLGAWLAVGCCMENAGTMLVCFAQNAELSVLVQQSAVFHHLPEEFKTKKLGQEEYISYTKQNGFAGNSLIFPNGSRILFKTYSQFQQNQTVLEGLELGSWSAVRPNLGAWCDEYLGGPDLINTLGFRLATRNAKMLLTFTPIEGYTDTVRGFLEGARTLESKPAELLEGRSVPVVQECAGRDAAILYLHTKDNPFSGYERVAKEAREKGEEWIKCRLYGIPTKSIAGQFPLFSHEVNVVKHEAVPRKDVTRYMILDPAGRKNWFMCWIAVDASGTYYVYREWPDASVGDWAKWHGGKWIGGEGAKGLGFGIRDYVDLILREEEGEQIFERLIDPRLGAAKYQTQTGASSIIEDLADAGLVFLPAPGLEIEDGIQALQSKMAYNRKQPIDGLNRPHFYVSERCQNIIQALQEYSGDGGPDEAWKDPIDVIRYAAIDGIGFVDPKRAAVPRRAAGY